MTIDIGDAGGSYLRAYLSHLDPFLGCDDVTDIYVNRPGEVWVERLGRAPERIDLPALDARTLDRLARQIAGRSAQGISRHHPLLSASLPCGSRVQVIAPPATRAGVAMAIRKQAIREMSLDDCEARGMFASTVGGTTSDKEATDAALRTHLGDREYGRLLKEAVIAQKTIIISGGTSTGKTTFLNALLRCIPDVERLITIEDTPEIRLSQPNAVGLIASRSDLGEAKVNAEDLLQASLRMRPSKIIMGELRGPEAFTYLRAINTGHPGSITTVHADSPQGAIEQIALMTLQSGTTLSRGDAIQYVRQTVGVIVQLGRDAGRRVVSAIALAPFD